MREEGKGIRCGHTGLPPRLERASKVLSLGLALIALTKSGGEAVAAAASVRARSANFLGSVRQLEANNNWQQEVAVMYVHCNGLSLVVDWSNYWSGVRVVRKSKSFLL